MRVALQVMGSKYTHVPEMLCNVIYIIAEFLVISIKWKNETALRPSVISNMFWFGIWNWYPPCIAHQVEVKDVDFRDGIPTSKFDLSRFRGGLYPTFVHVWPELIRL